MKNDCNNLYICTASLSPIRSQRDNYFLFGNFVNVFMTDLKSA